MPKFPHYICSGPARKFTLPKVLSDFTNTLLKKKEAIKRTFSEDYERNSSQTLHETIVNEKRPVLPTLPNFIWPKMSKIAILKGRIQKKFLTSNP